MNDIRIGHGYDVHRLDKRRKLILGGVTIQHTQGLLGHSDADVLVHAVMDSLLGAVGIGDIGVHFSDNDNNYKDANSIELLKKVIKLVSEQGYKVNNIDCTILAQEPKLRPYIEEMTENIAEACDVTIQHINIKATTEEHLGFTGEQLGIASHAVCTIIK